MPRKPRSEPEGIEAPTPPKGHHTSTMRLVGDPATDADAARQVCLNGVAAVVMGTSLAQRVATGLEGTDFGSAALTYAEDALARMAPRDPAEEMLVAQMLATHARMMHLSHLAATQRDLDRLRIVNEYADRAANTYRRQMLALAEYRKPPRAGDTFTAIRQANIAGQQVVMNGENSTTRNATNEQGGPPDATSPAEPRQAPLALPAQSGGVGIVEGIGTPHAAVGTVHGA